MRERICLCSFAHPRAQVARCMPAIVLACLHHVRVHCSTGAHNVSLRERRMKLKQQTCDQLIVGILELSISYSVA